jgi:hypothetical protein
LLTTSYGATDAKKKKLNEEKPKIDKARKFGSITAREAQLRFVAVRVCGASKQSSS